MNNTNFENWLRTQLIPNLPNNSVLVMDNASYHNVIDQRDPTTASKKAEMITFLKERDITVDEGLTKPEIYKIVKRNKSKCPDYRMDKIMKEHGHDILRLPPYSPEFNPIENIWGIVKNWVATNNTTFKLNDVEMLARRRFEDISTEVWANICRKVKETEKNFIQKEYNIDEATESFSFTVNTGSSDEDDDSELESDNEFSCSAEENLFSKC